MYTVLLEGPIFENNDGYRRKYYTVDVMDEDNNPIDETIETEKYGVAVECAYGYVETYNAEFIDKSTSPTGV